MSRPSRYKTKQKDTILKYIKSVNEQHVSVSQILEHFNNQNIHIGTSTIYRHLQKMVKDGYVKRYITSGSSSAYYQYIYDYEIHCHLKCEKCGKLFDIKPDIIDSIKQYISDIHNFDVDISKTMFYGKCKDCSTNI